MVVTCPMDQVMLQPMPPCFATGSRTARRSSRKAASTVSAFFSFRPEPIPPIAYSRSFSKSRPIFCFFDEAVAALIPERERLVFAQCAQN